MLTTIVRAMSDDPATGEVVCFMRHRTIAELADCSVATVKRALALHARRGDDVLIRSSIPPDGQTKGYPHTCLRYTLRTQGVAQNERPPVAQNELPPRSSQCADPSLSLSQGVAQIEPRNPVLQPGSWNSSTEPHPHARKMFAKLLDGYPRKSSPRIEAEARRAFEALVCSLAPAEQDLELAAMFGDLPRLHEMRRNGRRASIEAMHVWIEKRRWRNHRELLDDDDIAF